MTESNDRSMALYQVEGFGKQPTIEEIATKLDLPPVDIDRTFGVVLLDPRRGMYCVQVRGEKPASYDKESGAYQGPWSSPNIESLDDIDPPQ